MPLAAIQPTWADLDPWVLAFEQHLADRGPADLAAFLPEPEHVHFKAVLRELIRVDLEYCWERGEGRLLESYLKQFPVLAGDREAIREIAFEEFRLRRVAGENPSPAEYRRRFGVDTRDWPISSPEELFADDPFATVPADGTGAENSHAESGTESGIDGLEIVAGAYLKHCSTGPLAGKSAFRLRNFSERGLEGHAEFLEKLHLTQPAEARRLAQAVMSMPAIGSTFAEFQLVGQLGKGAFARVYLARQVRLADRPVVLKISSDVFGESQVLGQLQHTNIVPIYSVHRERSLQALCMPFLGGTTIDDLLKAVRALPALPTSGSWIADFVADRGRNTGRGPADPPAVAESHGPFAHRSYVAAVLWLGARMAEGLAHAHDRGILHRDLKPANVLLSNDGQPLLLDFNLSEDHKLRSSAAVAYVGGTLPYMSPEQLERFRGRGPAGDGRSDIYSLGLILYELLTGRLPFETTRGPLSEVLDSLVFQRLRPLPDLRRVCRAATPAVAALIGKCLAYDPADRYQSARELQEDIDRHLVHLPLRHGREPSPAERLHKWVRRHPRLSSGYTVGLLALVLLIGGGIAFALSAQRLNRLLASEMHREVRTELNRCRHLLGAREPDRGDLAEGVNVAEQALARYSVLRDADWRSHSRVTSLPRTEQSELSEDISELLFLLSRARRLLGSSAALPEHEDSLEQALTLNQLAEPLAQQRGSLRALYLQRAWLLDRKLRPDEARTLLQEAESIPLSTGRDHYLAAIEYLGREDYQRARPLLERARELAPNDAYILHALGLCCYGQGQYHDAVACFMAGITLWPDFHGSYYHRARSYLALRDYHKALADFDRAINMRPDYAPAFIDRSLVHAALGDFRSAAEDLTKALEAGSTETRIYFMRAGMWQQAGDARGAEQDRAEGLRRKPMDELSWLARGVARLPQDPGGAIADFDEALKLNPRSLEAWQNKAHVLSEVLGKTEEAVVALDNLLQHHPGYAEGRSSRGVLLARLSRRDQALKDASEALRVDRRPAIIYQAAGIFALTSRAQPADLSQAVSLLAEALRNGYGHDIIGKDPDLKPIQAAPEFKKLLAAVQNLQMPPGPR